MANEPDTIDARKVQRDTMLAEFRSAQQRRLVRVGKALWIGTERAQSAAALFPLPFRVE